MKLMFAYLAPAAVLGPTQTVFLCVDLVRPRPPSTEFCRKLGQERRRKLGAACLPFEHVACLPEAHSNNLGLVSMEVSSHLGT